METPRTVLTPLPVPSDRLWFDPAAVGRSLVPRMSTFTAVGGVAEKAAPFNPMRWAVGFMLQSGGGFNARVFPDPSVETSFGVELSSSVLSWFNLTTYGPLVSSDWWLFASPLAVIQVVEIVRVTRGY